MISRRRAFSLLGLAALGFAMPPRRADDVRGRSGARRGAPAVRSGVRHDPPLATNDVKHGAAMARYTGETTKQK